MRSVVLTLAFVALAAVALARNGAAAEGDSKVTYRWIDEKGVVHYGDSVPAQYSQGERAVLNRQGVEIDRLQAQKTPAQIAEEARREQELLRQKQHDTFLLTTYSSEKDIEQLRDARVEQLQGQRRAAEAYVSTLVDRLSSLQSRAVVFKPYSESGRRMPDDLASDIIRTLNEMRSQRNAVAAKSEEEAALRAQFQADIERYKQLRTASAGGRASP
jgi:hypothetical protein